MGVRKEEAKRGPGTSKCFSESPQPSACILKQCTWCSHCFVRKGFSGEAHEHQIIPLTFILDL